MTGWCHPEINGEMSMSSALFCHPLAYGAHDVWLAGLWAVIMAAVGVTLLKQPLRLDVLKDFHADDDLFDVPGEIGSA